MPITVFKPTEVAIRKLVLQIQQTGTATPTLEAIQNTIENTVTWAITRGSAGNYSLTFNKPVLTPNRTIVWTKNGDWTKSLTGTVLSSQQIEIDQIDIATMTNVDDIVPQSWLSIEIYNIKNV